MHERRLSDFDYELPPELIAQEPAPERDRSRMLVLRRSTGKLEHSVFNRLPDYLRRGDLLVMNDTRVIPARLLGRRAAGGGAVELLLLYRLGNGRWTAMVRPGRRLKPGTVVELNEGFTAAVCDYAPGGQRVIEFTGPEPFEQALPRLGRVPLPPYIQSELKEPSRYQTVYASADGSSAAPTAGLHFTPDIFNRLREKGIDWVFITLHIGPGTFQPVKAEDIRAHKMHSEYYRLGGESAQRVNEARRRGGRIVAVGTTACRVLETAADESGIVAPREGWTDLFIYPGYTFRAVDILLTNFHLPRSTLLMLVSAFGGHDPVMKAYREAVGERYRFYSFGDCMLLL